MESIHDDASSSQPPKHPVPQLQGPFEESMMESLNELEDGEQKTDSVARRKMLLQGERYERVCAGRWKQRPGEKFHPLWKLSAQLSFGIHLLAQGLAKSEEEVMRILQSHVDDIDGFLERTTEDFDLAQSDVDERLRYLRLPLEHVEVFDHMLDDRAFRISIVEGNEKIEHIVERTSEAMKDALKDVQKGIDATGALGKYLTDLKSNWTDKTPELEAVYVAMLGNVEGWTRAFMDLHLQGNRLAVSLVQLAGIVAEMQRRAGVASRKVLLPYSGPASKDASSGQKSPAMQKHQPQSPALRSPSSPQPGSANALPNKPLPLAPDLMIPARQASRAKLAHDEKLRRRSMEVLREREEKAKAAHPQTGRKTSMAEKVRSVTKTGSAQTLSTKTKSSKPADARSLAPSNTTSLPTRSPKIVAPPTSDCSPAPIDSKERSPHRTPSAQPNGAIELPAEVPRDSSATQEVAKKGGLRINLGSKHKTKEHGSGQSASKSLNIFRRSPHSPQPLDAGPESQPAEAMTPSPKLAHISPTVEETQQVEIQLSPPSVPPPQRSSPDPALPTPPALVGTNFARGGEPSSYTALPNVLATAQRATTVKAALRVSVPSSTYPEPEKTPRAIPAEASGSVHKEVTLSELSSNHSKAQMPPDESKHISYQSSLGEPGPEVPSLASVQASEQQSVTTQDDEKTPTTSARPQFVTARTSPAPSQEDTVESQDTALTSATMRSHSDFYKLPPQQTSPTPPSITPDGSVANKSIASSVASSAVHSRTTSVQDTGPKMKTDRKPETKTQPSKEQHEEQASPTRTSERKLATTKKKSTNPKELRLKPRNKDLQNQSELLDLISSTPPQSPIHTRGSSDGSARNAAGMTSSTSRILAPPDEAPPPPAPGGRSMIIPDYASAGAFEGERKPRRGSGMSAGGWKKMFTGSGGGSAPASSSGNTIGVVGITGAKGEDEEIHMSANLMSGEGNDVLWYKGMGRDGLWVSGA